MKILPYFAPSEYLVFQLIIRKPVENDTVGLINFYFLSVHDQQTFVEIRTEKGHGA
jgi:hypothetical protein